MRGRRLRLNGLILLTIVVGSTLAGAVCRLTSRLEVTRTEVNFRGLTDVQAAAVERRLAMCLESLYALRSLFHGSEEVTEAEFRTFASDQRARHPDLQALEWIPAVSGRDRYEHEEATRSAGHDVGMAIGDVCGHGLGPALVMSEVRALLRSYSSESMEPEVILGRANRALAADLEPHSFVTLIMATVDTVQRELSWVNAGHPSGFVLDARGDVRAELSSQTLPLGILPDLGVSQSERLTLEPGDLVLLVTDGVTEAEQDDRLFGSTRLLETVRSLRHRSSAEIAEGVVKAVQGFRKDPQEDDITLIVCRVGGNCLPDPLE